MSLIPTMRIVHDRRHVADYDRATAVEIEIKFNGVRKWISTGVMLCKHQWKNGEVINCDKASEYNNRIQSLYNGIYTRVQVMVKEGIVNLDEILKVKTELLQSEGCFLTWYKEKIDTRTDLRESTRKHHYTVYNLFSQWGKIVTFRDITLKNIKLWDDFLHETCPTQATIHNYHKRLRPYFQMAFMEELIPENPYVRMKIPKGETETIRYLTEEERDKIEALELHGPVEKARDMFIFGCYTGLAYTDIIKTGHNDIIVKDGAEYIVDKRQKTGNEYTIMLFPPAKRILEKYNYNLNLMTNQKCNEYLSIIGQIAQISIHLTMHVGRHTFATWALTKGAPIETVSKMLAHSDIHTTQIYAKVLDTKLQDGFNLLAKFTK